MALYYKDVSAGDIIRLPNGEEVLILWNKHTTSGVEHRAGAPYDILLCQVKKGINLPRFMYWTMGDGYRAGGFYGTILLPPNTPDGIKLCYYVYLREISDGILLVSSVQRGIDRICLGGSYKTLLWALRQEGK